MSTASAWGAMGVGLFKVADGGLGVAEGEAAADTGIGIAPGLAFAAAYTGLVAEGAHQFGDGFNTVFGDHHNTPAGITEPTPSAVAGVRPDNPQAPATPGATVHQGLPNANDSNGSQAAGQDQAKKDIADYFTGDHPPNASDLEKYAKTQGWTRSKNPDGPVTYTDGNGIKRITLKQGSPRAPGSEAPHVEMRNADGDRVDGSGKVTTRKSPGNHTPINYDIGSK